MGTGSHAPHAAVSVVRRVKLGLIARADWSGLGIQTWEFHQHMHPDKTLVMDLGHLYNSHEDCNKWTDLSRYPDPDIVIRGWDVDPSSTRLFLDGLDAVYSAETFYGWDLVNKATASGVRTYLHVNPEFCQHLVEPQLPKPTRFLTGTPWMFDRLPEPKQILPFPVAPERFPARRKNVPAKNFLHIIGRPAAYDRNGTRELMRAVPHITANITIRLCCLNGNYLKDIYTAMQGACPNNVDLIFDNTTPANYWELYDDADVLIMPRRWGGMSLPIQEAMGAGMPVILAAHDVYSAHARQDWVVASQPNSHFHARTQIDIHAVNPQALAAKIDLFAQSEQLVVDSYAAARSWADRHSWQALKPTYEAVFAE
jgi:glycosyltransferase involved in cell wall biosynthesis